MRGEMERQNINKNVKKSPRIMPNNIEAEQSLLGAILIDENVGTDILSELRKEDFYSGQNQTIFECMCMLQDNGKPIDVVTLSDRLIKEEKLDEVGGMSYLIDLTNILPSSANYRYYFDIVKKNGMLRKIIHTGNEIINNAYESDNSDMALAFAEKKVFEISDDTESKDLVHVNSTVNEVLKKYEEVLTNPGSNVGQLSYFKNLDRITNGYKGGQMIVLAARPGCGKTSFALNVAVNIARNEPDKVLAIFNLEMSISELTQRILLISANVPQESVLQGADTKEFQRLWQAKKMLEDSNLYIDDTADTTVEQIMSKCRRLKQLKGRLDFVIIDYLQLLKSREKRASVQEEVRGISRAIKILAKELDVPVIALSQTSRDLEKRDDGDPKMSDLRDSGTIEQDADQVYFLVKSKGQEGQDIEIIDLHVVKNRSGRCDKISFKWQGSMVKFTPVTVEEAKYIKQSTASEVVAEASNYNANNTESGSESVAKNEDGSEVVEPPVISGAVVYANDELSSEVDENIPVEGIEDMEAPAKQEEPVDWNAELNSVVGNIPSGENPEEN